MSKKVFVFFFFGLLAAASFQPALAQTELTADQIVQKVDEVRNPELDFSTDVVVTSYKPNRPDHTTRYEVLIKGRDKTIVKTLEPEIERGQSLLMRENDFWGFFRKCLSRSVSRCNKN